MNILKRSIYCLSLFFLSLVFYACQNNVEQPKPPTYLRIEVKAPIYTLFDNKELPFVFEYDKGADIEFLQSKDKNMTWFNIDEKKYNFEINASYFKINSRKDLQEAIDDCFTFLNRHEKLSAGILQQEYRNEEKKVYGTAFEIKGRDVVSPYQFYLTDSVNYFVRFALNNKILPNNDSNAVVIEQLKKDMQHMVNTFEWKTTGIKKQPTKK